MREGLVPRPPSPPIASKLLLFFALFHRERLPSAAWDKKWREVTNSPRLCVLTVCRDSKARLEIRWRWLTGILSAWTCHTLRRWDNPPSPPTRNVLETQTIFFLFFIHSPRKGQTARWKSCEVDSKWRQHKILRWHVEHDKGLTHEGLFRYSKALNRFIFRR